jgi:DNA-binding transcriptional regulator YdaS (Cro superfamily)
MLSGAMAKTPYRKAIEAAGSISALARALGITRQAVMQWEKPDRQIPAEHVPQIERHTGIPRWQLRPDLWERP